MSYDVYFEISTGNGNDVAVAWRNMTSNVSGMWSKALQLPEKPEFNPDGSRRMAYPYIKEAGHLGPGEPMYTRGLALLDGAPASEAAGVLAAGVERMAASPEDYRPMEPSNGWGSYEGALDFLRWMADTASAHPATTIRISR